MNQTICNLSNHRLKTDLEKQKLNTADAYDYLVLPANGGYFRLSIYTAAPPAKPSDFVEGYYYQTEEEAYADAHILETLFYISEVGAN